MKARFLVFFSVWVLMAGFAPIAFSQAASQSPQSSSKDGYGVIGTPAEGSKFSRIQIGWDRRLVTDVIGQPNDEKVYSTGKAWIPFYAGSDMARTEFHYKGEGILTFGGNGKLIHIIVNPNESGYVN